MDPLARFTSANVMSLQTQKHMTVTMGDRMQEGRKPVSYETHSKTVRPIQKVTLPWLGIVKLIFLKCIIYVSQYLSNGLGGQKN